MKQIKNYKIITKKCQLFHVYYCYPLMKTKKKLKITTIL